MNAHDRLSHWLIGLIAVLGVVVVSSTAGAQDDPLLRDQMRDRNEARAEKPTELRRQHNVTVVEPEFISAEELAKLPEITIYSEQSKAAGNVASGTAQAFVYKQAVSEERGYYTNLQPTTGYDPDPDDNPLQYEGAFFAEDMTLGNYFRPGIDAISGYSFRFFRSSRDPDTYHLAFIHMVLWDGDPLGRFDVAEDGYSNAPIAGTETDFVDIPTNYRFTAVANLPSPVVIPNERVWLVITSDACRLGFLNGGVPPTIGDSMHGWLMQEDDDGSFNGAGVCCMVHDPHACKVPGAICADDTDGSAHFCSDGDSEEAGFYSFSSPTYFNATAWAPTDTTMSWVPVGASGEYTITDSEITLSRADQVVELEVHLKGWDADLDDVPLLRSYCARLDSSGYTDGLAGTLAPYGPACTPPVPPDYPPDMCESLLGPGATCSVPPAPASPTHCTPGFINESRTDWVMTMCRSTGTTEAVDISTLNYRYGGYATPPCGVSEAYFGGAPAYGGTLVLEVPGDAKGTFTVDFLDCPSAHMWDANDQIIPLVALVPAKITVETGKCCFLDFRGDEQCADNVTENICETLAELWAYVPNEECTGLPNECGCIGASPPVASACCPDAGYGRSARHLSFTTGNPGRSQAIRVTFEDLPPPFDSHNGEVMWVGEPVEFTENSGHHYPSQAPGWPTCMLATLQCEPHFADFSAFGTLHVYHAGIVPGGTYEVQVLDAVYDPDTEECYSAPLELATARWGDVTSDCSVTPCTAPDGVVDFIDVSALVDKFKNRPGAPVKGRTDLGPEPLDHRITFEDIAFCVDAFLGQPYPFDGPEGCP